MHNSMCAHFRNVRWHKADGAITRYVTRKMKAEFPDAMALELQAFLIWLAVLSDTVDRVIGLEIGADDYIAKPFEPRELLARVKSVLRRTINVAPSSAGPRIRMGCRVLDLEKRVLVDPTNNQEETLTASEFDLLKLFAEHPNKPLQRDWLLETTAHRDMEPFDRAIDLRITRLRRKIEFDPAHPNAIRTVRGVGYMFVPPRH